MDWDETTRGIVLSSFFWGYVLMQLPGGLLAHWFGAKIVLLTAMTGSGTLNLLTPTFASFGWEWMCVVRIMNGLFQGSIFPCVHTLLSKWVHPSERSLLSVITLCGSEFGIFTVLLVSGYIAESMAGWPGIFYITGSVGLFWSLIWWRFGYSAPTDCRRISAIEATYLNESQSKSIATRLSIPWRRIWTSMPFIAIVVAHMCQNFGYYTLLTELPAYMNAILEYDITNVSRSQFQWFHWR